MDYALNAEIKPIRSISRESLERIIPSYSSTTVLKPSRHVGLNEVHFSLKKVELSEPFFKKHDYSDPLILDHYNGLMSSGHSYGVCLNQILIGVIICELHGWNSTLVVREFGIAPEYRNNGYGKQLMAKAESIARQNGARGIFCETQTTNTCAVSFYERIGFKIEGIDFSLYSNWASEQNEVAIFLRKSLS